MSLVILGQIDVITKGNAKLMKYEILICIICWSHGYAVFPLEVYFIGLHCGWWYSGSWSLPGRHQVSFGSGNGLVANRHQAINWSDIWGHMVALDYSEIKLTDFKFDLISHSVWASPRLTLVSWRRKKSVALLVWTWTLKQSHGREVCRDHMTCHCGHVFWLPKLHQ